MRRRGPRWFILLNGWIAWLSGATTRPEVRVLNPFDWMTWSTGNSSNSSRGEASGGSEAEAAGPLATVNGLVVPKNQGQEERLRCGGERGLLPARSAHGYDDPAEYEAQPDRVVREVWLPRNWREWT